MPFLCVDNLVRAQKVQYFRTRLRGLLVTTGRFYHNPVLLSITGKVTVIIPSEQIFAIYGTS